MHLILAALLMTLSFALAPPPAAALDLQGHRGARGLAPENTLEGFATALGIGVTTLEMDLAVSADGAVVVIHDPRLDPDLVRRPDGRWLDRPGPPGGSLTLAELRRLDVGRIKPGTRYARQFPEQTPSDGARIPTLAEVIALTRKAGNATVRFNVETKLSPFEPQLAPDPASFASAVVEVVRAADVIGRTTIQSFDWRSLQAAQAQAPGIDTVCLSAERPGFDTVRRDRPGPSPWTAGLDVDDLGGDVAALAAAAGCRVWSPHADDLDAAGLEGAHRQGLRVVVWTVNDPAAMTRLIELGVDGIITDYPDRLRAVMAAQGLALPAPTPLAP